MNKKTELSRERLQESFEQKKKINKFVMELLPEYPEPIDIELTAMNLGLVIAELFHKIVCAGNKEKNKALNSVFNLSKDVLNNGVFK